MACTDNVMYYHYEEVPAEGWDKRDTICFVVDTIKQAGNRDITLNLRTTTAYPYKDVTLMVYETVMPGNRHCTYPLKVSVANKEGERNGGGMIYHDIDTKIVRQYMKEGDVVRFKVFHRMYRWTLPGITHIGLKID